MLPAKTHHCGIHKQLFLPDQSILLSKMSIFQKKTKKKILKVDFFAVFADKFDEWIFFRYNLMPKKELKPGMIIFKNLPILSLTATLNAIETNVPPCGIGLTHTKELLATPGLGRI